MYRICHNIHYIVLFFLFGYTRFSFNSFGNKAMLTKFILISAIIGVCLADSWCYNEGSEEGIYCETGCCGSFPDEICCPVEVVWIVVMSVIGGIIFIGLLICVACAIAAHRGMPLFTVTEGPGRARNPPGDYTFPNNQQMSVLYGINRGYITSPPTYITSPPTYITSPPTYVASPPPYSANDGLYSTTKI